LAPTRISVSADATHEAFIGPLRLLWKTLRMSGLLLMAVLLALPTPLLGRRHMSRIVRWWHGRLLRVLNIRLQVHGTMPAEPMLIVTNHTTWLDIVILAHVFDGVFISKAEVGRWPIIGVYARAIGTLLLQRGAHEIDALRRQIQHRFAAGHSVVLFPEGTITGNFLPQRFHARLFAAAIDGQHAVLPVALHYRDTHTPTDEQHPLVPWVKTPLLTNFSNLF